MNNSRLTATIPFHITRRFAFTALACFFLLDVLFVLAYLFSSLPEIKQLGVSQEMSFIDLDAEANLPTNYSILKLYFSSIACVLMVFWYRDKAPVFWKIAAAMLFIIGLDESAQLHELWAAGVAVKLFGTKYLSGNQFTIIPYGIMLGTFYLSSLTLFPKYSKVVFLCLFLSGISLILSQAAEWSFDPAMDVMFNSFETLSFALSGFEENILKIAWEEGLEMTGYSLLCGGVLIGIHTLQSRALIEVSLSSPLPGG